MMLQVCYLAQHVLQWVYNEAQVLLEITSSTILDLVIGANQFLSCPIAMLGLFKGCAPALSLLFHFQPPGRHCHISSPIIHTFSSSSSQFECEALIQSWSPISSFSSLILILLNSNIDSSLTLSLPSPFSRHLPILSHGYCSSPTTMVLSASCSQPLPNQSIVLCNCFSCFYALAAPCRNKPRQVMLCPDLLSCVNSTTQYLE